MGERRRRKNLLPDGGKPVWMDEAKCRGQALSVLFYPERSNGEVQRAKNVCKGLDGAAPCPVLETCLDYALDNDEKFGVWGGTSERERRRIKKARLAERKKNKDTKTKAS